MNEKKRELIWHYANLIHENLCLKTDCLDKDGKLVSVKYVACIDDDPKSAVYAAWLYHKAVSEGQHPQVLCVGGLGLLSAHLKPKDVVFYSEGIRLAEVCIDLGVPIENIVILDKGRNSGENVRDIDQRSGQCRFCRYQAFVAAMGTNFQKANFRTNGKADEPKVLSAI